MTLGLAPTSGAQAGAARRLPAPAPPQRRLPDDLRLGGRRASRSTRRRALSARLLRSGGAVPLGERAGPGLGTRALRRARTCATSCIDLGYLVETLETSHTWSRLDELYRAVGGALDAALRAQGTPAIVMCHLSHAYRDGASLYFTFAARARRGRGDRAVAGGRRPPPARRSSRPAARSPTTTRSAATTPPTWRPRSASVGLEALRALKERLDPAGIMNPGKLLPGLRRPAADRRCRSAGRGLRDPPRRTTSRARRSPGRCS